MVSPVSGSSSNLDPAQSSCAFASWPKDRSAVQDVLLLMCDMTGTPGSIPASRHLSMTAMTSLQRHTSEASGRTMWLVPPSPVSGDRSGTCQATQNKSHRYLPPGVPTMLAHLLITSTSSLRMPLVASHAAASGDARQSLSALTRASSCTDMAQFVA
jgi:hypothetical protein